MLLVWVVDPLRRLDQRNRYPVELGEAMFGIRHILIAITFIAAILSMRTFGEIGVSLMPPIAFSGIALLIAMLNCQRLIQSLALPVCGLGLLANVFSLRFLIFQIGWWVIPLNFIVVLLGLPAVLLIIGVYKWFGNDPACTAQTHALHHKLSIIQCLLPWFTFAMMLTARLWGIPIAMS